MKRAKHAVYGFKYHFIWVSKYREVILQGPVAERLNSSLLLQLY